MVLPFNKTEYSRVDTDDEETVVGQSNLDGRASSRSLQSSKPQYRQLTLILLGLALWSCSIFTSIKITASVVNQRCHVIHKDHGVAEFAEISHPISTGTKDLVTYRPKPKYNCGITSAEAEAKGCVFDGLMASWIPRECPSYGREEFANRIKEDNLSYYYEENGQPTNRLIDMAEFPHMDGIMYWGTVMEHLTHCAYTLKRIIYTQHTHARFDNVTGNFSHTDHCVEFLISGLKSDPVNLTTELYRTDIPISFLEC